MSSHTATWSGHLATGYIKSYHLRCAGREELPFSWFMLCCTWLCFMPSSHMSLLPQKKEARMRCYSCKVSRSILLSDSVYFMHPYTHPYIRTCMHTYIHMHIHHIHTSRAKSPSVPHMVHGVICKSITSLVCNQTRSLSSTREARSRTQRNQPEIARLAGSCSSLAPACRSVWLQRMHIDHRVGHS